MSTFSVSGVYQTTTGRAINNAVVTAWKASRFGSQPGYGTAQPAGVADAGPVTTGTTGGSAAGSWTLALPTAEPYYICVTGTDSINSWQLANGLGFKDGTSGSTAEVDPPVIGAGVSNALSFANKTSPAEFWVSTGSLASDANSGDKDAPFATLAHAVTVGEALSHAYAIHLGYGNFDITVADGNNNGLTITQVGSSIRGLGSLITTVRIRASGLVWGIVATAASVRCEGFGLQDVAADAITLPYWAIGVTCAPAGTAEGGFLRDVVGTYSSGGTVPTIPGGTSTQPPAFFALGPDHPGATNMDIANWTFMACQFIGPGSGINIAAFLISNGTNENCTSHTFISPVLSHCKYGWVWAAGGGAVFGGGSSRTTTCDINQTGHAPGQGITYYNYRGELGVAVLSCTLTSAADGNTSITLDECLFGNYAPTAGFITFTAQGTLRIKGGEYYTTGAGASITLTPASANGPTLIVDGAVFDSATPFPPASASYQRIILGVRTLNTSTQAVTRNTAYQFVVDGIPTGAVQFSSPSTPAATASLTFVMAGLGVTYTPSTTGKALVRITGQGYNNTSNAGMHVGGQYGTGAAPANGAALTGTTFPQGTLTLRSVTATGPSGMFEVTGLLTGLTIGTAYWFDLAFNTSNAADTAALSNLSVTIQEVS